MRRAKISLAIAALIICQSTAWAQYFGNHSVQLPVVGWMFLGTLDGLNPSPWGTTDQIQIGTGYMHAIGGYNLWYANETLVGFSYATYPGAPPSRIAVGFDMANGLRYNFMWERWRPFVSLFLDYFQISDGRQNVSFPFLFTTKWWLGLRGGGGLEYIFDPNMSLEVAAGYLVMLDFENPIRQSLLARLSYRLYF